jgi:hypothetical protein
MLFGSKDNFAIESSINYSSKSDDYTFGSISAWIGNCQIGEPSGTVILEIPVNYFKDSLEDCGNRSSDVFEGMNYLEIFDFLDVVLWGKDQNFIERHSSAEIIEFEKKYSKYNIFAGISEAFDGEAVFLVETEMMEVFIWQDFLTKEIKKHNVAVGTYKSVVKAFLDWYAECQGLL